MDCKNTVQIDKSQVADTYLQKFDFLLFSIPTTTKMDEELQNMI